jgi:hypothetical protein
MPDEVPVTVGLFDNIKDPRCVFVPSLDIQLTYAIDSPSAITKLFIVKGIAFDIAVLGEIGIAVGVVFGFDAMCSFTTQSFNDHIISDQ